MQDGDGLRHLIQTVVQEALAAEMTDALGAAKGQRSDGRRGHRSGQYPRAIITCVLKGKGWKTRLFDAFSADC